MGTTPSFVSSSTPTVKIDGVDLHTFGVMVESVNNPVPKAKPSDTDIPGRHGDMDFARRYGTRKITLSGVITGDTHAQMMTNIDDLKEWLRLRENRESLQVIFQDQTDRYWTVRYDGDFSIISIGLWHYSTSVKFRLGLKCLKPYAEKTTVTATSTRLTIQKNEEITYAGTFPTPLNIMLEDVDNENLLEKKAGDCSEDNTLWTYDNASGSDDVNNEIYGTNGVKATQTAPGAFYANITVEADGTFEILDKTKNYVVGCYLLTPETTANVLLQAIIGGADDKEVAFVTTERWPLAYLKIQASDLTGATSFDFRILDDGVVDTFFNIDGAFIYEITATEYADDDYLPLLYVSDPAGDDIIDLINPSLILHRNYNIIPYKNGEALTDWVGDTGNAGVVADPLGYDANVVLLQGLNKYASSPRIYITGGKIYRVTFEHYCPVLPAGGNGVYIGLVFYNEADEALNTLETWVTEAGASWVAIQIEAAARKSACYARFRIYNNGQSSIAFVKNIMVAEGDALEEGYDAHIDNNRVECTYTGTLSNEDLLIINSDRLTAFLADYSAGTNASAMSGFSGDRLILEPGTNILRLTDARVGAANPESASNGFADVIYSYRERYL